MSVMANGWGTRDKARLSVKRTYSIPKQEESAVDDLSVVPSDEEIVDVKPISVSSTSVQIPTSTKRSIVRLDNLIMEVITSLKEPGGSNKTNIAAYIEEQYWAPPEFKKLLSAKLKYLTACGRLIKVKCRYMIVPALSFSERMNHSILFLEGRQRVSPRFDRDNFNILTKSQIDLELARMRTMTPQEAAAAAARAVAEAEAAIAEAEEAAREAEVAEADAEAAQAFAEAAMKTLKGRNNQKVMVRA
ncbi:hypothetical protein CRYUN_Cryun10bG0108600 [Craigia yunnanensis]